MKTLPRFRILPVIGSIFALLLLAGCFETQQEFTLNPDGSGKVVHQSKFQTMDLTGSKQSTEKRLKAAVAEVLGKSKGVAAWRDVSYELLDDGRISFKGTAYFQNLSELDIPNQTMLEFDWTRTADDAGTLTLRAKSNGDREKPAPPKKLPSTNTAQELKESRAKYQQAKPMMAMILGAMSHEVVFHLPGRTGKVSAFREEGPGQLSLRFDGGKMIEAMEKLINDDAWMANNSNVMNADSPPPMDEQMSLLLFGAKGPVQANVSPLGKAAFDYASEVAAAQEAFVALQEQLGAGSVAIMAPAQGGALKGLKVVGVQLVRATDEQLEVRPFNSEVGYTLSLLAELPGSVLAMTDECGLDTAIADDGSDLLPESDFRRRIHFPKLSADKTAVIIEAQLNLPGDGVKGIREISGHLQYKVAGPTKELTLGFAKLAVDAKAKELGAEIKSFGDKSDDGAQTIEVQLDIDPDTLKALYLVIGKEKTELQQRGYGGGGGTYVYTYESEKGFPAKSRIVAEIYDQQLVFDTPFKLENITLLGEPMDAN